MPFLILGLLIVILIFTPQIWVQRTMKKYGHHRPDLQGTGGELAEHLVERFKLDGVVVRQGDEGADYYDPREKVISLSPGHYSGQSITAVAVAAHEVGHAIQHKEKHSGFMLRQKRIQLAMAIERFSAMALMVTPFLFLLTRVPQSTLITLVIGMLGMLVSFWVQIVNLPIELDASFNKALPILKEGYLPSHDMAGANKVLKVAAFTYAAGALASFLNLGRWIAILRR